MQVYTTLVEPQEDQPFWEQRVDLFNADTQGRLVDAYGRPLVL